MAIAKDIPEVYLCEYDTDRESITPYAGQKCIMANGDIYICITAGSWLKLGEEPAPPAGFPYTFTIDEFITIDGIIGLILNRDGKLGLEELEQYKVSIVYNNVTYSAQLEARKEEGEPPVISLNLDFEGILPPEVCPDYTSTINDGFKMNTETFDGEYGNYSCILLTFAEQEAVYEAFKNGVSKIILEEVNA